VQDGRVLNGHSDGISALVFSTDGKTLISGSHDKSIRLWDVTTGQVKLILPDHVGCSVAKERHQLDLNVVEVALDHIVGHTFYSIDSANCWVMRNGQKLLYLPIDNRPYSFTVNGSTIAIGDLNGQVTIISFMPI
jgi:WD40 repeat protein